MYKCAYFSSGQRRKRIKSDIPKVLHKVCGKEMANSCYRKHVEKLIQDVNVL